jgi:Tol biopolymer transport system component
MEGIDGGLTDGTPFVAVTGQTLYFDSRRRDGGGRDLWRASLGPRGWGTPTLVPNVNSDADEQNPWLSADERLLVFNSNRGGDPDLWAAVWNAGDFGTPFPIGELNSSASDEGATLTRDGLTVFFASNRPGGTGGLDIWVASRGQVTEAFSTPRNLAAINGGGDELDPALGPDGQELLFASSRDGGYQLYRAARSCD